jgi:glycosyltransferase involved in cell wall biosynthesis
MRILFLANPLDVHDVKWMSYFSYSHDCAVLARSTHYRSMSAAGRAEFSQSLRLPILGELLDFSVARPWRTLREFVKLWRWLRSFKPDLVHIHFAEPNALWSLSRCFLRGPSKWLLTTRGTDILVTIPKFRKRGDRLGQFLHWLYRRAFAQFDALAATSRAQILIAQSELGYSGPTAVVRTGVDVESLRRPRAELVPESLRDRPFIFFPRLMAPVYGQELSLDVIEALPKQIKSQYTMVFVDRDQGDPEYLRQIRARMEQLSDVRIEFLPSLQPEEVWELYKAAALTVMTPRSDGTPVSAMESLLCGTQVVVPPLNYDPELAQQMLVSSSWEPRDFVEQIKLGLGKKVQIEADSAFYQLASRAHQMTRLEQLYQSLLG